MISENLSPQLAGAERIEDEAAAWLWRRSGGDWREEDQAALDMWIAKSHSHLAAFWRLEAVWERTARLAALRRPVVKDALPPVRGKARTYFGMLAAGVMIAGAFGAAMSEFWPAPQRVYSTAVGGHALIRLADGSEVELNTDTMLRTDINDVHRIIYLDRGEAYFTIHHDAKRAFTVLTRDHRINDLGTKFVAREDAGRLKVSLLEGRVRLETTDMSAPKRSALLAPGDVAVATGVSISVVKKSAADLTENLGWRHNVIVFKDATLADATSELNRYNRRKFVILDPAVARQTISGTIATTGVETFMRAARNMLALHVEPRGGEIVITR